MTTDRDQILARLFPGLDKLIAHWPDAQAGRWWPFALIVVTSFILSSAVLLALDRLGTLYSALGQAVMILAAFTQIGQLFWRRAEYRLRWGACAYQEAFKRHVCTGIPIIIVNLIHIAFFPGDVLLSGWPQLAASILGGYWVLAGLVLWLRAIFTFGFDSLALLYVYHPEEGRLVDSAIYRVMRHPVYGGIICIGLGLGLLRGTALALAFGLYMPVGLSYWVRWVEEPELIERFGDGYLDYRRRVPAFWPYPRNLGKFFKYLFTGR